MDLNNTNKFCFFYKETVPDLGPEFVYVKLGKAGRLHNPLRREVIVEERFRINLAAANPWLWNFTGLYLLHTNRLVRKDNVMVVHYDVVLDTDWKAKVSAFEGKLGVLGDVTVREWMGYDTPASVVAFQEIDEVFRQVTGEGFWSVLKKHKVERVAGWGQFLATRDTWERMMAFLTPLVEHVKDRRPSLAYPAHLIEMCWGYFCALENYRVVSFLHDGPPSTHLYGMSLKFDVNRLNGNYERILKGELTAAEAYQDAGLDPARLKPYLQETTVSPVRNHDAFDADSRSSHKTQFGFAPLRAVARFLLPLAVRRRLWKVIGWYNDNRGSFFTRPKADRRSVIRRIIPRGVRRRLRTWLLKLLFPEHGGVPGPGWVEMGHWRRLQPISRDFGSDRGRPIDRYYIENFLQRNADDVQGRVLELGDPSYTRRFGGSRVTQSDVLHAAPGNPVATVVGDLVTGAGVPREVYDCMIVTQGYHVIYHIHDAVRTTYAALKPGGVLLATLPCMSQISRPDMDLWGDYWRMTDAAARRLFGDVFGPENVTVEAYGNVLVGCAFLQGLAWQELTKEELDYKDRDQQVLITVRAVKQS